MNLARLKYNHLVPDDMVDHDRVRGKQQVSEPLRNLTKLQTRTVKDLQHGQDRIH